MLGNILVPDPDFRRAAPLECSGDGDRPCDRGDPALRRSGGAGSEPAYRVHGTFPRGLSRQVPTAMLDLATARRKPPGQSAASTPVRARGFDTIATWAGSRLSEEAPHGSGV